MTSNKEIIDDAIFNELLAKDAENAIANLRIFIASLDWSGLIAQAMACDPAPLRQALVQILGRKDLYPPELVDFLALMEAYKSKRGAPRKDGNELLIRAAAKAWDKSHLKNATEGITDFYNLAEKYKLMISAEPERGVINIRPKRGKEVFRYGEKPTDFALELMAEAGFGKSADALRDRIYGDRHKKKKSNK